MKNLVPPLAFVMMLELALCQGALAQTIPVHSLPAAPTVDGDDGDWGSISSTTVVLKETNAGSTVAVKSVAVKGAVSADRLFLFFEWQDDTEDKLHKPWVWNEEAQKYLVGPQREDRLAVQFAMEGNYTTNWRSGDEFKADTWHWKASRSNPLGLAHDKSLSISRSKLMRAYKLDLPDGGHVYMSRPSDSGDKLYKTKRYRRLESQQMPKYVLADQPQGSVADVVGRGVWSDGRWRLELSRKLNTGNEDDVVFPRGPGQVAGGIAIFDHSENDDHSISDTLVFDFLHHDPGPE